MESRKIFLLIEREEKHGSDDSKQIDLQCEANSWRHPQGILRKSFRCPRKETSADGNISTKDIFKAFPEDVVNFSPRLVSQFACNHQTHAIPLSTSKNIILDSINEEVVVVDCLPEIGSLVHLSVFNSSIFCSSPACSGTIRRHLTGPR